MAAKPEHRLGPLDALAERRIEDAIARGELDQLPGAGRPLVFDDDLLVPIELRAAYRILKNAGFVPPEVESRRELATLEAEALSAADEAVVRKIRGRIALLRLALAGRGPGADRVHIPVEYLARWIERVSATPASAHPSAPTPPVADPERD